MCVPVSQEDWGENVLCHPPSGSLKRHLKPWQGLAGSMTESNRFETKFEQKFGQKSEQKFGHF
jgi:hypothetical protein